MHTYICITMVWQCHHLCLWKIVKQFICNLNFFYNFKKIAEVHWECKIWLRMTAIKLVNCFFWKSVFKFYLFLRHHHNLLFWVSIFIYIAFNKYVLLKKWHNRTKQHDEYLINFHSCFVLGVFAKLKLNFKGMLMEIDIH